MGVLKPPFKKNIMKELKFRELYILYRALRDLKTFDVPTPGQITNDEASGLMDKVNEELQIKYYQ